MHRLFSQASAITGEVVAAAIEVHRTLGPGLLESIYDRCLQHELKLRGFALECQRQVFVVYKDLQFEEPLRLDILVNGCLLLELKAVQEVHPIHKAQVLSYMKLLDVPLGLLINFHEERLTGGVHRLMLPRANQ